MEKKMENRMEKKLYNLPQIMKVELDNEISLALESAPPAGPRESLVSDINSDNPYKLIS